MKRCFELAVLGAGMVAPNPMVGAVLVHGDRIIGEGYHEVYAGPHAEVNCVASVKAADVDLIPQATMYVSLEPCAHFGKTPPCADLIIKHHIPKLVIACRDPFSKVNGEGIRRLKAAGIDVTEGILEQEAIQLNKRFFSFHQKNRPYITLKWAQTADGFIAGADYKPLAISGPVANRWVHRMRSEEAAIMVGYNTALYDNPQLTTRLWHGKNPLRIVIDKKLLLSPAAEIYNSQARTLVLNELKDSEEGAVTFIKMPDNKPLLPFLMDQLYHFKVNSLIVEGGSKLLTSFIEAGIWDEAFVIKNIQMLLHHGVSAPSIPSDLIRACTTLGADQVEHFINNQ